MNDLLANYSPEDQHAIHALAAARTWEHGIAVTLPSGLTLDAAATARLTEMVYAAPYVDAATADLHRAA